MTKEELEKEASSVNSYKAFQLQEENKTLAQHILELQNDKGELTDRCKELEIQIEKMKRCEICKHYRWNHCSYEINISEDCIQNKLKHFELKEIKEK